MAKLVDALALGASPERGGGSSPPSCTTRRRAKRYGEVSRRSFNVGGQPSLLQVSVGAARIKAFEIKKLW